jgi:hypothetical protein
MHNSVYQILHSAKYWSLRKIQRFSKTNILVPKNLKELKLELIQLH